MLNTDDDQGENRKMELNTANRPMENEEIEIDLLQLWNAVRHRIWLVLLAGFVVADIAFAITKFLITPMYSSSATMLVVTKETTLSSLADLQLGSQLTNDYEILISSRPVLQETIEELNLDTDYKHLRNTITISNPNDSRMLIISTLQADPELAKSVVDTVAGISGRRGSADPVFPQPSAQHSHRRPSRHSCSSLPDLRRRDPQRFDPDRGRH